MSQQPIILAEVGQHRESFPPGVESFHFDSWIPALRDTVFSTAFTKVTFLVWAIVGLLIVLFLAAYRKPKMVPSRGQWMAESVYGMVRDGICKEVIGAEGVRFAPYFTTLFCFIFLTNFAGIFPVAQISPNSHIAFPIMLAVISYLLFIVVGVRKHGFGHYFKMSLIPPGTPWWLLPIIVPIEFMSNFITRPVTLAVRLFANMFAGHMILLVFTLGGVALLNSSNMALRPVSVLSFGMAILMTFFEFVVQLLQAYVFVLLTASYVQGSLAEEH